MRQVLTVIPSMKAVAKSQGAKTLRVEASFGNVGLERLANRRFGFKTEGGLEIAEFTID